MGSRSECLAWKTPHTPQEAITWATERGSVVVAAAGNDHTNGERFPCVCQNIICVGATTSAGNKADYINFGHNTVHISAPGGPGNAENEESLL